MKYYVRGQNVGFESFDPMFQLLLRNVSQLRNFWLIYTFFFTEHFFFCV